MRRAPARLRRDSPAAPPPRGGPVSPGGEQGSPEVPAATCPMHRRLGGRLRSARHASANAEGPTFKVALTRDGFGMARRSDAIHKSARPFPPPPRPRAREAVWRCAGTDARWRHFLSRRWRRKVVQTRCSRFVPEGQWKLACSPVHLPPLFPSSSSVVKRVREREPPDFGIKRIRPGRGDGGTRALGIPSPLPERVAFY